MLATRIFLTRALGILMFAGDLAQHDLQPFTQHGHGQFTSSHFDRCTMASMDAWVMGWYPARAFE